VPKKEHAWKVRVSRELDEALREFCQGTRREPAAVVRDAVELLLADGPDVAELRIMRNLWDLSAEDIRAFAAGLERGAAERGGSRKRRAGGK